MKSKTALFIVIAIVVTTAGVWFGMQSGGGAGAGTRLEETRTQEVRPAQNASTNATPPDAIVVRMTPETYIPTKLTITVGQTVTFTNESGSDRWPASNIHPSHEIYPEFDPRGPVRTGESWSFTFDRPGIWRMHDHLVPGITGVVEVE